MGYAVRVLRRELAQARAVLHNTETHIKNAARPHPFAECSCRQIRRTVRKQVTALEAALAILADRSDTRETK